MHSRFVLIVWLLAACSSSRSLALEPPPLADLEEPSTWHAEPDDEAARLGLPLGAFSGVHVGDARRSLEALTGEPEGVLVIAVVENSPAVAAGIEVDDLLLAVRPLEPAGEEVALSWPSQWRELELASPGGARWEVSIDRAGAESRVELTLTARLQPADRQSAVRLREEHRVGIVVRAATEVEARAAGLGPGAGAVVVGLARGSPWRARGIVFGDLLVALDGRAIAHPEQVLTAIGEARAGAEIEVELLRDGARQRLRCPVSERDGELKHAGIPLLFDYERERGASTTSILLGLFRWRRTSAAWDVRLLWLIHFGGGDADRLERVDA